MSTNRRPRTSAPGSFDGDTNALNRPTSLLHLEANMSLLRGRIGALLLTISLVACAGSKDSPVAPTAPAFGVTAMSPTSGDTSGGTAVVLSGFGFTEGATVTFGGMPATEVRVISSTLLRAIAPSHAPGEVDVWVAYPDRRSTQPSLRYRYVDGTGSCAGCWDY